MKKTVGYGAALLLAAGLMFAAAAQQGGMMQGNMMHGKTGTTMRGRMGTTDRGMGSMRGPVMYMMGDMQNPLHRSFMTAFLLPEMHNELALSPTQNQDLAKLKDQFVAKENETLSQIAAKRKDLDALFKSGTPTEKQVKNLVTEITNLQTQRQMEGFHTALKMQAALTPQQKSQFEAMKPAELGNAMMSHMTMREMGDMMLYMHGATWTRRMTDWMQSRMMRNRMMMYGGMMSRSTSTPSGA